MGKITLNDLDKYGGNGGGSFFSLKNDKDVAQVRIMLNGIEDMENFMFSCHEITIGDRKRYVNCLREYNDPIDVCPFCVEHKKIIPKIYIPLYNMDSGEVQVWERGKKFMSTFSSFAARYKDPSLVAHVVEVERNGKPGDMQTTYQLYEADCDETTLEDLPELPEILGGIVLDKSVEDMECYLETGEFPPEDSEDEQPIRRRGSSQSTDNEEIEEETELKRERDTNRRFSRNDTQSNNTNRSSRRTPAGGGNNNTSRRSNTGRRNSF